jgi:hypothetical protein
VCYSLPHGIGFSEYGSDWKLILLCAGICDGGIEGKDNFVSYLSAGLSAWSKQHSGMQQYGHFVGLVFRCVHMLAQVHRLDFTVHHLSMTMCC